jgi:hypothetical protein
MFLRYGEAPTPLPAASRRRLWANARSGNIYSLILPYEMAVREQNHLSKRLYGNKTLPISFVPVI